MEKECAICGQLFETPTAIRKYCDDCLRHGKRNRSDIAHAEKRLRSYWEPEVREYGCYTCGKRFRTISRLLFQVSSEWAHDGERHVFCSQKCEEAYRREYVRCRGCGKSLKGTPGEAWYTPGVWQSEFCSEECRKKHFGESAPAADEKECPVCGKKFRGNIFCSQGCYRKAVKDGWRPHGADGSGCDEPKYVERRTRCACCGKGITVRYRLPLRESVMAKPVRCGECRRKAEERRAGRDSSVERG